MNKKLIIDLDKQILNWKAHMLNREIGHDLYYVDPNGRQADLTYLRELQRRLEEAKK